MVFDETSIIRGDGIAIPNRYYGFLAGPVIIGMFDPGLLAAAGVFCLVMEDTILSNLKPLETFLKVQGLSGVMVVSCGFPRVAFSCSLQLTVVDTKDGTFQGELIVDHTRMASAVSEDKPHTEHSIITFHVLGTRVDRRNYDLECTTAGDTQILNLLAVDAPIRLQQLGHIWLAFYTNPAPGCFYLQP